jgi:hypothetical protein
VRKIVALITVGANTGMRTLTWVTIPGTCGRIY